MKSLRLLFSVAQDKARRSLQSYGREAGLVLFGRVLQNINGFMLSVLIVRRFGLPAAGTLAVATVATVIIAIVGTFGLTYVFARRDEPTPVKNALGFTAALIIVPLSLPFIVALGLVAGHSLEEAAVIAVLSLGGCFFAQTNIANSLQVLQGRAEQSIIPPFANFVGLIAAGFFGSSYLLFASILAAFRFIGTLAAFLCLERARIGLSFFWSQVRAGAHFLTADILNLGSDQVTVLVASFLMSRTDLGVFGLCRQMLTVSDTPGWSQVQAKYPVIVSDPSGSVAELRRTMPRLGVICGAGVAALTVPLGLFVYHSPLFMILAPLLLASVPLRYLLTVYDVALRAVGAIMATNRVTLIRAALGLIMIPGGAWLGGATGAVVATIVHTAISVWLTRRVNAMVERPLADLPVPGASLV
jgi:O-antigen/teichoic acid export membrane protein